MLNILMARKISKVKRGAKVVKKAVKSVSGPVKKLLKKSPIRRVVKIEALDQVLLGMAANRYEKILQQIQLGKKRFNDDRKLALQIGNRILDKAKKVRDSLMGPNKNS